MLTRKTGIEGRTPFKDAAAIFREVDEDSFTKLAMIAGEVALVLDETGTIIDAMAREDDFPEVSGWIGLDWLDTVTVESRPKVMEMMAAARKRQVPSWRQINHPGREGDIPIRYTVVSLNDSNLAVALGRDMREAAGLQQRLLQAQQSLERDYMRLRQLETRYRLLFELSTEPVLIIDNDGFRVREANPAAEALLGSANGSLAGSRFPSLFDRSLRETIIAFLGSSLVSSTVTPIRAKPTGGPGSLTISASGFRQQGKQYLLVRLSTEQQIADIETTQTIDVIEKMPDAFVLADANMEIVAANLAFVELIEAASVDQIVGRRLAEIIGRPGIDLDLIESQLAKHGFVRNVSTVVSARIGVEGEPVEIAAVRCGDTSPHYGFVIRPVGRRLRDLPPAGDDRPRSVEQLTELVGRMSMKDIVRESTDLIERLCIEAALAYTSDNRASAAEILGLSRQSLYSKLHRYGLGNLESENE